MNGSDETSFSNGAARALRRRIEKDREALGIGTKPTPSKGSDVAMLRRRRRNNESGHRFGQVRRRRVGPVSSFRVRTRGGLLFVPVSFIL
ncbi:hypothetical protein NL676_029686 [Syzygium grande]|nr:hypothetical protein NL676_029686 [Syzygium grande]